MDKMTFSRDRDQQITVSRESVNKILADLIAHFESANLSSKDAKKDYLERINEELFNRALTYMAALSGMMKPNIKTKAKKVSR
jgi:uncharacterized protein (DUF2461 family)